MIWWIEQIDWMVFACWKWWNNFWFDDQSTVYLWQLNAGRKPLQLYFDIFRKNFLWEKMTPKIGFFLYFEKFCHSFVLETYLNKNCYCSEFDLTGCDSGFTTRFWISTIELFVIMNSFTITERNKNQWI